MSALANSFIIILIIGSRIVAAAHSKLGCEIFPILLESKENGRWRIKSLTCVNDAR